MKSLSFDCILHALVLIKNIVKIIAWENVSDEWNLASSSIFEEVISKYKLIDRIDYLGYVKGYWSDYSIAKKNDSLGVVAYSDNTGTKYLNRYMMPTMYDIYQKHYLGDADNLDEAVQVLDNVHIMLNSR